MRLLAPFALIVTALAVVVWIDDTPSDASLVFVNQNEVFTLDPQRMSYIQDLRLAHALYEGLVRWDNADFSIVPAAAEAMPGISEDGRTYTFRIRPEARWSNGDPVTAHDLMYTWQRAMLPDTAADYSNMFFAIEGAAAFFDWRSMQTAGFVADPWSGGAHPDPHGVTALVTRLDALLAAHDLPPDVARPAASDRLTIAAELDRLRSAAVEGGVSLAVELRNAVLARSWLERLDEASSRVAESAWMWQALQRRFEETVGLHAPDEKTLVVRLVRPTAYFLDQLCFGVFFPVHRPTVEGWPESTHTRSGWHRAAAPPMKERRWVRINPVTGKLEQKHEWAKPGRHVGNGTHQLEEWRYKRDLRLARSPSYHDQRRVKTDSILVLTIEDTNTAVLAFESGHVDWLADVSAEYQSDMIAQMARYQDRHAVRLDGLLRDGRTRDEALALLPPPEPGERRNIHVFPTFGTEFFSFNCRRTLSDGRVNPFADAGVRRAFSRSIDKKIIVERVTRLKEPVMNALIPPNTIEGYEPPAGLSYDRDAARREFRDAGWLDRDGNGLVEDAEGRPFPVIDLLYTTNVPRFKWICLELKSQWERELGVRVELRPSETKFYREDLKQGKFMIARGRWYGDYGDPTTFLDLFRTTDGNNDRRYSNPLIDDMLDAAAGERDPVARMAILRECERILFEEEVPMLILCQLVQVYMYEPGRVRGLSVHPRLTQFLWQMEVVEP